MAKIDIVNNIKMNGWRKLPNLLISILKKKLAEVGWGFYSTLPQPLIYLYRKYIRFIYKSQGTTGSPTKLFEPATSSNKEYFKELNYYLRPPQTFEQYTRDTNNPKKEYVNLKIGAYFQVFNQKKATFEVLKSFREYYPDSPVYLLSDEGDDFSDIAEHFNCDYEYSEENIAYWPCKNILGWFARLNKVCEKYSDCDWILLLEDDVRTRDKISKMPRGHLCGQGGGNGLKKGKQISKKASQRLLGKFSNLEINGISGCGGSIFHRKTFIESYKNVDQYNIRELENLDDGLTWATDFALTYLFLMNGFLARRWLDLSEEATHNYGPASAFDHQFKKYYGKPLSSDDMASLVKIEIK